MIGERDRVLMEMLNLTLHGMKDGVFCQATF